MLGGGRQSLAGRCRAGIEGIGGTRRRSRSSFRIGRQAGTAVSGVRRSRSTRRVPGTGRAIRGRRRSSRTAAWGAMRRPKPKRTGTMQREDVVGNDGDARSGRARGSGLLFVDDELQPPFPLDAPDTLYIRERPRIALTNRCIVAAQHRDQGVDVIRTHDDLDEQGVERIHDKSAERPARQASRENAPPRDGTPADRCRPPP